MNRDIMTWIGRRVRHFKGGEYLVVDVAHHTEDCDMVVIYRALYGACRFYVIPLYMFMSEVDTDKYPNSKQQYRMELIQY